MTQDRASGCVCALLSLVGQPTPIRPITSPAATSTRDHRLPVSVVSCPTPTADDPDDLGDLGDAPPPAFVWPSEHAWCVACDVDPHFASICVA